MALGQVVKVVVPAYQAIRALGFGFAAFIQRRMVGVGVFGPEQIGNVAAHIVLLKRVVLLPGHVGGQIFQPVFPGIEAGAGGRIKVGHRALFVEIGVGRRVGNHVAHLDAFGLQGFVRLGGQGIALRHLCSARMPGDDHFAQMGEQLAVAQALQDLVYGRVRTQGCWADRGLAGHPVIGVPAQYIVGQRVTGAITFVEKLRRNHQGCG